MESLYHQTYKLVQETQHAFVGLERFIGENSEAIEKELQDKINLIARNCERLDLLVYKEPIQKRQSAKLRVDQLKYDNQHLQAGLQMFQQRQRQRAREEREREELLSRRFTQNSSEADTSIFIDYSVQHNMSLQNSNRGVDDMLRTGTVILENLKDQRSTLKGAQKRLFDIANTLGLSNTTMRLIERRVSQDKVILIGGMVVTVIVIIIVLLYFL